MTGRTQLSVDLVARVGAFEAGMKRATQAARSASSTISDKLGSVGPAVAAGVAAAGAATFAAIRSAVEAADQLGEAAQRIGIPPEVLSSLEVAGRFSDVTLDQLQSGLQRLVKAQAEAAREGSNLDGVFDAIGVSATNSDGSLRATQDVILDLADVFRALPDGPEKAALALEIFGRSGSQLTLLLNQGREGLQRYGDEALKVGAIIDGELADGSGSLKDQIDRLNLAWDGFTNQLARATLPTLTSVAEGLRDITAAASQTFAREGLIADDFFGQDSGLIAQLFRDRGFDSPTIIPDGQGPSIADVLGGARAAPAIEFITPETLERNGAGRDGDQIQRALRDQRQANERNAEAKRASAAASRALAEAEREAEKAAEESKRAAIEQARVREDFNATVADYQAALDGPMAQAELDWARRQEQLEDLAKRGQISTEDLAKALGILSTARERDLAAIDAQLSPSEQVIADIEEELRLLGLSNTEREIANALRYAGVDAMSEEGKQISEGIRLLEEARERIQFSDDIRAGFEDTFASIIDGSKSAKDAFEDLGNYITQLVARRLGDQLVESLLGPSGSPIGDGGGNIFTNLLGSLFGGPRAAGGFVAPGKMYEVAERGPELLTVGGRQYLLPMAASGMVTANPRMGRGGSVVQNISITGRVDSRTASQLAAEASRAQRRVSARFGA